MSLMFTQLSLTVHLLRIEDVCRLKAKKTFRVQGTHVETIVFFLFSDRENLVFRPRVTADEE